MGIVDKTLDRCLIDDPSLFKLQLIGHCRDCHWLLPDTLCRMILWGPRQYNKAKNATEVTMVVSYSLKVHPGFGCALWRDKRESRKE